MTHNVINGMQTIYWTV